MGWQHAMRATGLAAGERVTVLEPEESWGHVPAMRLQAASSPHSEKYIVIIDVNVLYKL